MYSGGFPAVRHPDSPGASAHKSHTTALFPGVAHIEKLPACTIPRLSCLSPSPLPLLATRRLHLPGRGFPAPPPLRQPPLWPAMAKPADFTDYKRWVLETKQKGMRIGRDGPEDGHYIPFKRLEEYWDEDRVRLFLTDNSGHNHLASATPHTIVHDYLRIFATFVFISSASRSCIGYLDSFVQTQQDDLHFPFDSKGQLGGLIHPDPNVPHAMEDFYEHQFLFSPVSLASRAGDGRHTMKLHNRLLNDRAVLPMVFKRKLSNSLDGAPAAQLCLFELALSSGLTTKNVRNPCFICCLPQSSKWQDCPLTKSRRQQLVVAKIFPEDERDYDFRTERSTYFALAQALNAEQPSHVLDYYGSFVQSGRGVILIEYANHGSLLELFEEDKPPYTLEETMYLWKGLASLFNGLAALHNLAGNRPGDLVGVHQDLQPSNIFVFSDDSDPKGKYSFKIGDFGLSRLMLSSRAKDGTVPDSKGPPSYRAPELMYWNLGQEGLNPGVNTTVDMWSMGCVLLETAVWSVCGERGRKEFRDNRNAETATNSARACHGTFHDGRKILAAVENIPEVLRPRLRVYDNVTLRLCRWVCDKFLLDQGDRRLTAGQAGHFLLQEIGHAQGKATEGTAFAPKDNHPGNLGASSTPRHLEPADRRSAAPFAPSDGDDPSTDPTRGSFLGPVGTENSCTSTYCAGHPWTAVSHDIPRTRSCTVMGTKKHTPDTHRSTRSFSNSREPSLGHSAMSDYPEPYFSTSPGEPSETSTSRGSLTIHVPNKPSPRPPSTTEGPIPMQKSDPHLTTIQSLVKRRKDKKDSPSGLPQDLHNIPDLLADRDQVCIAVTRWGKVGDLANFGIGVPH